MDDRRHEARTQIRLDCVLTRRKGSPISCHTIDVGPGGMRVSTDRPLGVDEVVHFDLAGVDGDARVLREQGRNVYALRIETIREDAALRLSRLAA